MVVEKVCHRDDLWDGEMLSVEIASRPIILIKIAGAIQAFQGWCPHQAHPLAEAEFDGETLTCGAHLWQFEGATGKGINPRHARLRRFEVFIDSEGFVKVTV